jgi:hypothetical protein
MKRVECAPIEGADGNVYDLALGPQILKSISESYQTVLPKAILDKIEKWADDNGGSAIEIVGDSEKMRELVKMNVLTPDDSLLLARTEQEHNHKVLTMCIRKMNGHRVLKHPHYKEEFDDDELAKMSQEEKMNIFYEEIMPSEDYSDVMGKVNEAVFTFKFGLDIEGKLKLVSMMEEEKQAQEDILQSSS